jgi:hypothetical protein
MYDRISHSEAVHWLYQLTTLHFGSHTAELQYQHLLLVRRSTTSARKRTFDNMAERRSRFEQYGGPVQ